MLCEKEESVLNMYDAIACLYDPRGIACQSALAKVNVKGNREIRGSKDDEEKRCQTSWKSCP